MYALARLLGTTVQTIEEMPLKEYQGWIYLDQEEQNQTRKREQALKAVQEWREKLASSLSPSAQVQKDSVAG